MAWRIEFEGQVYREVELTMDQAERVELLCEQTWRFINPLYSAKVAKRLLAVMYADRQGVMVDEALDKVGALTTDAFTDMVTEDPSPAAGASTPADSGSSTTS